MKKLKLIICTIILLLTGTAYSQVPSSSKSASFECEVVLDIYNGLKDWSTGRAYSGGQLLTEDKKKTLGAVTVVNSNDTDGDDIGDSDDASVSVSTGTTVGRNEIDLIKIVIRKRTPGAPLSGSGDITLQVPDNVRIWKKPTKEEEVSVTAGEIHVKAVELPITFFAEATAPSPSLRSMKFVVEYNNNSDFALATAVWVKISPSSQVWFSNSSTPVLGVDLPRADKERFKYAVNTSWISVSGQRYGYGSFYSGQPQQNSTGTQPPHPLTSLLPGIQDKEIGGRILFEYNIQPQGSEELVNFDCARQKKARPYRFNDFEDNLVPVMRVIDFPFERGEDNEKANDDGNNISDEDQYPTEGFIYSADRPGNNMIEPESKEIGFKVNKITFIEYIRLQVKSGTVVPGNNLVGSRCSGKVEWHCVYYLRRSTTDRKLLADNNMTSASEPNRTTVGNGIAKVSVTSISPSSAYTIMFTKGNDQADPKDDQFILLNTSGDGEVATRNGSNWNLNFNGLTVNISEGTIPFEEDDTFIFNVFNSTSKINMIGLGEFDVTSQP